MLTLLLLPLRCKRDALLARFRARQIAGLCRFEVQEQSCIGAGAFAVAVQALRQSRSGVLCFELIDSALNIYFRARRWSPDSAVTDRFGRGLPDSSDAPADTLLRLVKPLPKAAAEFAAEDLEWLVSQLRNQTAFRTFEEIQHQNQEMLILLHSLRVTQEELSQIKKEQANSSAA